MGGTHSEWTHSEQPLPSHPVVRNPSEAHGESVPTTGDSVVVHPVAEDPIRFEDSAAPTISAQNDDIPVIDEVHPAVNVSVELDISASASPSSSTRSVFSDSPFSTRLHSEFHLVAPVSPVLCLDKCNVLLFCEGESFYCVLCLRATNVHLPRRLRRLRWLSDLTLNRCHRASTVFFSIY